MATSTAKRVAAKAPQRGTAARSTARLSVVKSQPWWGDARAPSETSTAKLATTKPEYGGDYLNVRVGMKDGEAIAKRGIKLFSLESIKKRTVVLATFRNAEDGRGWGSHKIRMTKTMPPHFHLPVEDGKYRVVESRADETEIELRFEGDKIVFELPPAIR